MSAIELFENKKKLENFGEKQVQKTRIYTNLFAKILQKLGVKTSIPFMVRNKNFFLARKIRQINWRCQSCRETTQFYVKLVLTVWKLEHFPPTILSQKFRQSNFFTEGRRYSLNWFHEKFLKWG